MSSAGSLGRPPGVATVSDGGTGSSTPQGAREILDVPALHGDNEFVGTNSFNGEVTVLDENLTVTGSGKVIVGGGVQVPTSGHAVTLCDPDWSTLTADRHLDAPNASGTIIVSADTPAAGTILYYDGGWKALAAPGDALPHTLTITNGVLSWV